MKKIYVISLLLATLLVLFLYSCSSGRTVYREYNVESYEFIEDSISDSGTEISPYKWTVFTVDGGRKDSLKYATLYKEKKATGSVQIRKKGDVFNVKVIDFIKK